MGQAEAEFRLGNHQRARTLFAKAQRLGEDELTAARIELCSRILELDPTGLGIELRERHRRSRALVERARASAESCRSPLGLEFTGPLKPLTPGQLAKVEQADEVIGARRPRATVAAVESNVLLAEEIWSLASDLCGTREPPDQPLAHVMEGLSR